jgi:hypothetical protein
MSGRWRIKLACWIAGDPMRFAEAQAADLITAVRKVALEEAAKLCDDRAKFYETHPEAAEKDPLEYQGAYAMGAHMCAETIRERKEGSPEFGKWLKGNLPLADNQAAPRVGKGAG